MKSNEVRRHYVELVDKCLFASQGLLFPDFFQPISTCVDAETLNNFSKSEILLGNVLYINLPVPWMLQKKTSARNLMTCHVGLRIFLRQVSGSCPRVMVDNCSGCLSDGKSWDGWDP